MTLIPGSDGITWHPQVRIEKYSADQVAFVRARQAADFPRFGALLHGSLLRGLCASPEDGTVYDEGNGVTAGGTANLARVLTGTGGHFLAPGRAVFGVGGDAAPFDREHVHLSHAAGEQPGQSWYRPMDASYPRTEAPGVIEGQATFSENEACFAWHEWCWAAGEAGPAPHHSLRGAYGGRSHVMWNRRSHPAGYGEKEPGVAWVFRTQITLSLRWPGAL